MITLLWMMLMQFFKMITLFVDDENILENDNATL